MPTIKTKNVFNNVITIFLPETKINNKNSLTLKNNRNQINILQFLITTIRQCL